MLLLLPLALSDCCEGARDGVVAVPVAGAHGIHSGVNPPSGMVGDLDDGAAVLPIMFAIGAPRCGGVGCDFGVGGC